MNAPDQDLAEDLSDRLKREVDELLARGVEREAIIRIMQRMATRGQSNESTRRTAAAIVAYLETK